LAQGSSWCLAEHLRTVCAPVSLVYPTMSIQMKIPENLYGSTLLVPMTLERKHDGTIPFLMELFRTYMLISVSYAIQFIFLHQVYLITVEPDRVKQKCTDENVLLQCVCVFTFEAAVFYAVRDAVGFASLLWEAPTSISKDGYGMLPTPQAKARSGGAILDKQEAEPTRGISRHLKRVFWKRDAAHEPWSLRGMSKTYKVWSFLVLAIPQITICVLLSYIGGDFISSSEDKEALIMNTVGVLFINQLGDTMYLAFTSITLKEDIALAKGIDVQIRNETRWTLWVMSVFFPVFVFAYTLVVVFFMKMQGCPHYQLPWSDRLPPVPRVG